MKNDDLVVMPRKAYEALIRAKNGPDDAIAVRRTMRVPKKHKAFYDALDNKLTESLRDVDAGNVYGPFNSVEELRKSLES